MYIPKKYLICAKIKNIEKESIIPSFEPNEKTTLGRILLRLSRFLRTTMGMVTLVLLAIYVLLQSHWFQNWTIGKITAHLSEKLHTTVKVEHVGIDIWSNLALDGFYLEDQSKDTLVYVERLHVDFERTISAIMGNGFTINGLILDNAKIRFLRKQGQPDFNYQYLVDYFRGPPKPNDPNKKSKIFDLKLGYLSFKKVDFHQKDEISGNEIYTYVDEAAIDIEEMDLLANRIKITSVDWIEPHVIMKKVSASPLPKALTKVESVQTITDTTKNKATTPKPLEFSIKKFRFNSGIIAYDNYTASSEHISPGNLMDFNHLLFEYLNIDFDNLVLKDNKLSVKLSEISAREQCGFILDKFAATEFRLTPKRIELNDFIIKTPFSQIKDTVQLMYKNFGDFQDFNENVKIKAILKDCHLAVRDLMPFSRKIAENRYVKQNQSEVIDFYTTISGRVNRISADTLMLKTKGLNLYGNLKLRNINDPDNVFIGFNVSKLESDINTVKLFAGKDSLPRGVEKFGKFRFNGFVYGFPYNFSAQGSVNTELGKANMDFVYKPDPKLGKNTYNGGFDLVDFDLGSFASNAELGKVTFAAKLNNGVGFTQNTEADLSAQIKNFTFKGYTYENLTYKGKIDSRRIDGEIRSQDKNIDFSFKGKIDLRDSLPQFDFVADINRLALHELKLSKDTISIKTKISINGYGSKLENLNGHTHMRDLTVHYKSKVFKLDSLTLNAVNTGYGKRHLDFSSEQLRGYVDGNFEYKTLAKNIQYYIYSYHHNIAARLGIKEAIKPQGNDIVSFKIDAEDISKFSKNFDKNIYALQGIHAVGQFDSERNSLSLQSIIEKIAYQKTTLQRVGFYLGIDKGKGATNIVLGDTKLNNYHVNMLRVIGNIDADKYTFSISENKVANSIDSLNLQGLLTIAPQGIGFSFGNSSANLLHQNWRAAPNNYIFVKNKSIATQNLAFINGIKKISINSIDSIGLKINIQGYDASILEKVLNDNRFTFGGKFEVDAEIGNVFKMSDLKATLNLDTLVWNKRDWGKLQLKANSQGLDSIANFYATMTKDDQQVIAEGFFVPTSRHVVTGERRYYPKNYLSLKATTSNIPMLWISYLVGSGVSDMQGTINADISLKGPIDKLELDGKARVKNASFTIDYLKTRYFIPDDEARLTTELIDATGAKIYDENGNFAVIEGGLTHKLFDKMRLKCVIDSRNQDVLIMRTTKADNSLYYGTGRGKVRVRFSGSFSRTFINVERAITGKGTQLNIPVSYAQDVEAVTFVKFIDKRQNNTGETPAQKVKTSGLGFEMTLTMTEDAECRIIFNEQTGDIIQGRGTGVLKLDVPIGSDFTMYGDYTFSRGDYLFTIREQFFSVDKPFVIRPGGTLRWNGDPFGAKMDLWADYSAPNIPPYELVAPLLSTDDERQNARQPTEVNLAMNMQGQLLKPDITFDIRLPQLFGQMKSFADTRINQIKQDNSELNRQVFGIIILGGFLPSDQQTFGAQEVNQALNNTLSGLISRQLANYVNGWLKDVVKENGIISGVDLNINTQGGVNFVGAQVDLNSLQVRPRINLFDNKLSIDAGLITSEDFNNKTYVSSDLAVEWYITRDRLLRFRVYNRGVQDVQGRRNRTGAGFSWRKDFETWRKKTTS